jgi:hypothetical protein
MEKSLHMATETVQVLFPFVWEGTLALRNSVLAQRSGKSTKAALARRMLCKQLTIHGTN